MAGKDAAALALEHEMTSPGQCVITAHGQIDLYSAPEFKETLLGALDEGARHLVVDLSDVDFMDSTGLGVLVGISKRVGGIAGTLAIVAPNEMIRRIFDVTGLADRFAIFNTREAVPTPPAGA